MDDLQVAVETVQQPMVLVAGWGRNHVYYFEVDHVPESDEYFAMGQKIAMRMMATIGQIPDRWKLVRQTEFDPEDAALILKRDPIQVS